MSKLGRPVKNTVRLSHANRTYLEELIRHRNRFPQQTLMRARILLKADAANRGGGQSDAQIARALKIHKETVKHVRRKLSKNGLEATINRKPRKEFLARLSDRGWASSEHSVDGDGIDLRHGVDERGVRNLLWKRIVTEAGGVQTAWAARYKIPLTYFNAVLRGDQAPSKRVLCALGLKKVVLYRFRGKSGKGNNR